MEACEASERIGEGFDGVCVPPPLSLALSLSQL